MGRTGIIVLATTLAFAPVAWSMPPDTQPGKQASKHSGKQSSGPVMLGMGRGQRFTLNGTPTSQRALVARLSSITGGDYERPIVVRADARLPYGQLVELLNQLRLAGFTQVMIESGEGSKTPGN